jgi:hypothetical protein
MLDDVTHQGRLERNPQSGLKGILQSKDREIEKEEISCAAFGWQRSPEGLKSVELRFQNGNSRWFPYGWLGTCDYNPSEGVLLKFSGDLLYLVLIRGSNLDRGIDGNLKDFIRGGLARHHVTWLREMTSKEIGEANESEPVIDKIEVGEFETHAALKEWLKAKAPAFLQGPAMTR